MKHGAMRTIARGLILDRDSKVASADWARLFNDHCNRIAAEGTDHTTGFVFATSSLDFAAGEWTELFSVSANAVIRILEATLESSSTTSDGTPLRPCTPQDIWNERRRSTSNGTPRMVAFERLFGHTHRFRALIHPPPSALRYVAIRALIAPSDFSVSSIDDDEAYDLPQEQIYRVVREAAIDAGAVQGRFNVPGFEDSIRARADQLREDHGARLEDLAQPRFPWDEPL